MLATVCDKLTLAPAGFAPLLADMQASAGAGGLIARAANRQLGKGEHPLAVEKICYYDQRDFADLFNPA